MADKLFSDFESTLLKGSDRLHPNDQTWYCIAIIEGKESIIGNYSNIAVLQNPDFQNYASGLIWNNFYKGFV